SFSPRERMPSGARRVGAGQPDAPSPVTSSGIVDLSALDRLLAGGGPALVSVMLANNETGIIQPIKEVSELTKKYGALLHCDAAQGFGKIPVDFGVLGCDLMTLAAHKCGGPVGAAALVVRRDLPVLPPLTGGGQESGRRAGTENVAAIAGFARAVELFDFRHMKALRGWLDEMEAEISSPGMGQAGGGMVFGKSVSRLPNTSCIAMPGVSNEVQLMDFDLNGFAVSAGSACSSGRIEPSHVLAAMGVPEASSRSAIRISGGRQTTEQDITSFTEAWKRMYQRLSRRHAG
ncbi:MAG: aminotransferase class V-fold PLP-dependent enzyme, partial [Pseudomonadota bacterium]|nr:aminotransferase class V-fold PLP-dependent enzyme [Pseudomonadota bacterium]